jgi:hypothetical protein
MSSSVFSLKNFRWVALLALLVTGFLGGSLKGGVVNMDLTGYKGDNAGFAPGNSGFVYTLPGFTELLAYNQFFIGTNTLTGLEVGSFLGGAGIATTGNSPVKFGAGATIDASSTFTDDLAVYFKTNARTVADFGPNSFLGFKTSGGLYGYIEVTWTASTNTFRLISAAYEDTPGVAIQTPSASTGGEVPEPASAMIASMFLGGVALRRWRNKRA